MKERKYSAKKISIVLLCSIICFMGISSGVGRKCGKLVSGQVAELDNYNL